MGLEEGFEISRESEFEFIPLTLTLTSTLVKENEKRKQLFPLLTMSENCPLSSESLALVSGRFPSRW